MQDNHQGIRSNPFYLLHAMPRESDQKLLDRVQEMKLLYGISAEEAETWKKALMHPGSRLAAEIGFLPDTPKTEADALRTWLEHAELRRKDSKEAETGIASEESIPEPADFFAPHSSLASLNGVAAMLQYWSVSTPERACAACLSLAALLGQIRAETVQEEINRDREAGGHQKEESLPAVAACLQEHQEAIMTDMAKRCMEALSPYAFRRLRILLAEQFSNADGPYYRSQILDRLVCRHLGHAGAAEAEYNRIAAVRVMQAYKNAESREMNPSYNVSKEVLKRREKQHAELLEHLQLWNELTKPERMITRCKGYMEQTAKKLLEQVNDFLIFMVNTCHDFRGGRALLANMEELFSDMPQDSGEQIRQNKKKLYVG